MKTIDAEKFKTDLTDDEVKTLLTRLENNDPTLEKEEDILEITKALIRETYQIEDEYKRRKGGVSRKSK